MSKFKVGDKVRFVGNIGLSMFEGENGIIVKYRHPAVQYLVDFEEGNEWCLEAELKLVEENCECKSPIGEEGRPTMDYELEYYRIVRELEDVKLVNEILLNYIREIQ